MKASHLIVWSVGAALALAFAIQEVRTEAASHRRLDAAGRLAGGDVDHSGNCLENEYCKNNIGCLNPVGTTEQSCLDDPDVAAVSPGFDCVGSGSECWAPVNKETCADLTPCVWLGETLGCEPYTQSVPVQGYTSCSESNPEG